MIPEGGATGLLLCPIVFIGVESIMALSILLFWLTFDSPVKFDPDLIQNIIGFDYHPHEGTVLVFGDAAMVLDLYDV